MKLINILAWVGLPSAMAHMRMKYPHPRGDPNDQATGPSDYDLSAPMTSAAMCHGKPPAGQVVQVQFDGSARHGGGMCQFSLSYDGTTFVVIEEIVGSCPNSSYNWPVTLPSNLPSCERCTFAWTWINAIGNREFYMNCADVKIIGGPSKKISGESLYIANLAGFPTYEPPVNDGPPSESQVRRYPVTVN